MAPEDPRDTSADVAIIGMVGRFPGAPDLPAFWRNLEQGVESISHFTDEEIEPSRFEPAWIRSLPSYVRARGVMADADKFDAAFFGVNPLEASVMDPQHRVFLEGAWAALENAGYDVAEFRGLVGIWAGMSSTGYLLENVLPRQDVIEQAGYMQVMLANEKDFLATRVSYKLNLRGPSVNVYTACSTSLVAVCHAYQALLSHQCDVALAGGVSVVVPQKRGFVHLEGGIFAPDGRCRPFDAAAAGTVSGDGLGIVVLKRFDEAIADGDTLRAVIRGAALNNDGSLKVSFTAPSVDGQAEVIAMAQAMADVDPRTISYVEAHGTATPLGDPIEIAALTQAFRAGTDDRGFCAIGALKSNIGHLDAAAGVAGLIKTVLALEHRMLPPTLHFTRPNPKIDFASSPFVVNAELRPWPAGSSPRRAGVSSFGLGGTNAHVVLEEAPVPAATRASREEQLLVLSARTEAALASAAGNLARHLRQQPDVCLADVAHTLQVGRRAFGRRLAVVARDAAHAAAVLEAGDGARVVTGTGEPPRTKVVFLFPGQGSQAAGMGAGLYRSEPVFRAEIDGCAAALLPHLQIDIRSLLDTGPAEAEEAERRLRETALTQPVLFAIEYALARLWISWGVAPAAMIGHSLGEYVAACLAGVLSRDAAAVLVAARGRLMQQQPGGSMLAVRLPAAEVERHLGPDLAIAAFNAPALSVVSGPDGAIAALESTLSAAGLGSKRLATSHAFHSAMMEGALRPFGEAVAATKLSAPRLPWISGVTGEWITPEQAVDPDYWVRQMRQPVHFSQGLSRLAVDDRQVLLEVGPGRALSTLVRQHRDRPPAELVVTSLGSGAGGGVSDLLEAAGRLWTTGVRLDWAGHHGGEQRRRVPLPTYPFERKRHWIDARPADEPAASPAPPTPPRSSVGADTPLSLVAAAPRPPEADTDVAGRLREILSNASGVPAADIDASRSFLDLGFDSLLLIQVSAAIKKSFDMVVTFRQLLETLPTVAALAAHIGAHAAAATVGAEPAPARSGGDRGAESGVPPSPPVPGARLGRDASGQEAWFVPDPDRPGKYLKVTTP